MKPKFLTALLVCAALPFLTMGADCGGSDKSDDTSALLVLWLFQSGSAFSASCNKAGSNICTNHYGAVSATTQSSCNSDGGVWSTSSRCTATSAIGACKVGNTEDVYYTGHTCGSDSCCKAICDSQSGTYNADYSG